MKQNMKQNMKQDMKQNTKPLLTILCNFLCLSIMVGAAGASAQNYPEKPVKLLVPFAPGGVADLTARVLAQKLSQSMGQQVVVENRPSAGGIVASEAVAKSDPDGYTLLLLSNANAVSATLFKSLPYDTVKDFAPVSTVGFFDILALVGAESRFKSVSELVAFAKAGPGKVNIGTINVGSTQNLAAELFKSMAGVDVQIIPYKGTPEVVGALRRDEVQVAFEILAPVKSQIEAGGAMRALAIASSKRFAGLPGVPTVAESGVPGYFASSWNAVAAPAKTPRAVIDRLNKEINTALAAADVRQRLQDMGVEARAGTADALRDLLAAEIVKWKSVIEKAKIEKQ